MGVHRATGKKSEDRKWQSLADKLGVSLRPAAKAPPANDPAKLLARLLIDSFEPAKKK